jgi:hypothetical protein
MAGDLGAIRAGCKSSWSCRSPGVERSPRAHVQHIGVSCRAVSAGCDSADRVADGYGPDDKQGDAQVATDWGQPGLEPRVEEMVSDPIVQLIMRRDQVTVAQIMATVIKARARLQPDRPTAVASPPPA